MEAQQRDYSKSPDQRTSQTPACLYLHVSESERVRIRAWRCVSDGEQEKRTKDQSFRDSVLVMFSSVTLSFSYSYRFAELIFPPYEKAFRNLAARRGPNMVTQD